MCNFKARMLAPTTAIPAPTCGGQQIPIPKVGVVISHTRKEVRIRDLDQVYQDVLIQGEDMQKFQDELRQATKMMPDVPIADALYVITAPFIAGRWS